MAVKHPTQVAHEFVFEKGVLHQIACFEFPQMPDRVRAALGSLTCIRQPDRLLERFGTRDANPDPGSASSDSRLRLAVLVALMTRDNVIARNWFQDCAVLAKGPVVGVSHFDLFCFEEATGLLWELEQALATEATDPADRDVNDRFDALHKVYQNLACSTAVARLLIEARRRNIPALRLSRYLDVYQFGYGTQRRRFQISKTGATPRISGLLTTFKPMATDILRRHGLPTPDNAVVPSYKAALKWIEAKGAPVVIKPTSQDMGTGVTTNITTKSELKTAFEAAQRYGRVMVEKQIPGDQVRIVVIDGQPLATYRIVGAFVVGDGERTIHQLARDKHAARQQDPDTAGKGFANPASREAGELLAEQGLAADSVPEKGRTVHLDTVANVARGGERQFFDLSDIHPDNLRMAQRAAELFDIDFAGVDFITEDISESFVTGKGAINEVNISPALPFANLGDIYFDHSYKDGKNGAIPISVIVGDLSDQDAEALGHAFFNTGPASRKVAVLNNRVFSEQGLEPRTPQPPLGIWETALADGRAHSALLHITPDQLNSHGFPVCYFDRVFVLPDPRLVASDKVENASVLAVAAACEAECQVATSDDILRRLA